MVSAKPEKEFALAQKSVEVITITLDPAGKVSVKGSIKMPQEEVMVLFKVSVFKAVTALLQKPWKVLFGQLTEILPTNKSDEPTVNVNISFGPSCVQLVLPVPSVQAFTKTLDISRH